MCIRDSRKNGATPCRCTASNGKKNDGTQDRGSIASD
jgi:hypothetical protein